MFTRHLLDSSAIYNRNTLLGKKKVQGGKQRVGKAIYVFTERWFIIAICVVECVYPEIYYSQTNEDKQATENATNYSRQIDFLILSMLLEDQNRMKIS